MTKATRSRAVSVPLVALGALAGVVAVGQPAHAGDGFTVVALGTGGGLDESNLSSYMVGVGRKPSEFILLDAGTIVSGLSKDATKASLTTLGYAEAGPLQPGPFFIRMIKGFLISHPHLDHVAGLGIASAEENPFLAKDLYPKPIIGLEATITGLKSSLFNGQLMPNFGDSGTPPPLVLNGKNVYAYRTIAPSGDHLVWMDAPIAGVKVAAFPILHHAGVISTAFLLKTGEAADADYLLYYGDTGPGKVSTADDAAADDPTPSLDLVRRAVKAELRTGGRLLGIFLEVSFPNVVKHPFLFGHLNPDLFVAELAKWEFAKDGPTAVATHLKPKSDGSDRPAAIAADMATVGPRILGAGFRAWQVAQQGGVYRLSR